MNILTKKLIISFLLVSFILTGLGLNNLAYAYLDYNSVGGGYYDVMPASRTASQSGWHRPTDPLNPLATEASIGDPPDTRGDGDNEDVPLPSGPDLDGMISSLMDIAANTALSVNDRKKAIEDLGWFMRNVKFTDPAKQKALDLLIGLFKDENFDIRYASYKEIMSIRGSLSTPQKQGMFNLLVSIVTDSKLSESMRYFSIITLNHLSFIDAMNTDDKEAIVEPLLDIATDTHLGAGIRASSIKLLQQIAHDPEVSAAEKEKIFDRLLLILPGIINDNNFTEGISFPKSWLVSDIVDIVSTIAPQIASDTKESRIKATVGSIIQALGSQNIRVAQDAQDALVILGPFAVGQLIQALGDSNAQVSGSAAGVLIKIGKPAIDSLIQSLGDSNAYIRLSAAWVLGQIRDLDTVDYLLEASIKIINDPEASNVIKEGLAIPLLRIAQDKTLHRGVAAINALKGIINAPNVSLATKESLSGELLTIAEGDDDKVEPGKRQAAIYALASIARDLKVNPKVKESMAPRLLAIAKNSALDKGLRQSALYVLSAITNNPNASPASKEALAPGLLAIAGDDQLEPDLRITAVDALAGIARDLNVSSEVKESLPPDLLAIAVDDKLGFGLRQTAVDALAGVISDPKVSVAVKVGIIFARGLDADFRESLITTSVMVNGTSVIDSLRRTVAAKDDDAKKEIGAVLDKIETILKFREEIFQGYGFTPIAAEFIRTHSGITITGNGAGGGGWVVDRKLVLLYGRQHEAALHELTHVWYHYKRIDDAIFKKDFVNAVIKLADMDPALSPEYAQAIVFAKGYVYGNSRINFEGQMPGVSDVHNLKENDWNKINDWEMFAGMASFTMGKFKDGERKLPEFMHKFFSPIFTGGITLKPYYVK